MDAAQAAATRNGTNLWVAAAAAAAASTAGNLLIYGLASGPLQLGLLLSPRAEQPFVALAAGQVIGASIVPALAAAALVAVLVRFTRGPLAIFNVLAAVVLVGSMLPVATMPTDGVGTRVVLGLMHLISAGAITFALNAAVRSRRATPRA